MLSLNQNQNLSFVIAFLYFMFYSFSFSVIGLMLVKFEYKSNNIAALNHILDYNSKKKQLFVVALISLLGVPPLSLFLTKFAALSVVWANNDWILFFFALLSNFLSFALYLHVFDILFIKKSIKKFKLLKGLKQNKKNLYSELNCFVLFALFTVFAAFFFKDLLLALALFF